MADEEHHTRSSVLALLTMHGLQPGTEDLEAVIASFQPIRAAVDLLYEMRGVRYEDSAVNFDPRLTP